MSDWQPIETAPKDGSRVFGWAAAWALGMPEVIVWLERGDRSGWFTYADHYRFLVPPTHWIPVPEPPTH